MFFFFAACSPLHLDSLSFSPSFTLWSRHHGRHRIEVLRLLRLRLQAHCPSRCIATSFRA